MSAAAAVHDPGRSGGVRGRRRPAEPEPAAEAEPGGVAGADWTPPTWDEVVRDHSARVYRLAYRLTGNPHDAEDLTQDVFVRVFRSLSSYTPGTFEGWLHRITTNLFLDQVRRKQRIRFDGLADDAAERLPGREPTPGPGLRRHATSTTTSSARSTPCRRTSAPPSCSATSRASPTRRSPPRSASSWAPSAAASTAAARSCAPPSSTGPRPPPPRAGLPAAGYAGRPARRRTRRWPR